MGKKIIWLVVSGLMALSLVVAACGQAATPTTPTTPATPAAPPTQTTPIAPTTPTAPIAENTQKEAVKPASDIPKYGGTITVVGPGLLDAFDSAASPTGHNDVQLLVYEQFLYPDWSKAQPAAGNMTSGFRASSPSKPGVVS